MMKKHSKNRTLTLNKSLTLAILVLSPLSLMAANRIYDPDAAIFVPPALVYCDRTFSDVVCWSGLVTATATDSVIFTRTSSPRQYTVNFDRNTFSTSLIIRDASVIFDLNRYSYLLSGDAFIGHTGNGELTILDGTLGSSNGYIGYLSDDNSATVNGTYANWINTLDFTVGYEGAANSLAITNGGSVSNSYGYIGRFTVSDNNNVSVDGAGSTWVNSLDLTVGFLGASNSLAITNGGSVSNDDGYIGRLTGSDNNNVSVDGAGSTWANSINLTVGRSGASNSLAITTGGSVSNRDGYIGYNAGAVNNNVSVDGAGSAWVNSSRFYVGYFGASNSLAITTGGSVSNSRGYIGYNAGAVNNNVSVDGAGSTWANSLDLFVGNSGASNSLAITNGGSVSNDDGYIGRFTGSDNNNVSVDGAGSTWANSSDLFVGNSGASNSLAITNGGSVSNRDGYIASDNNNVSVDGAGSTWVNSSSLTVGNSGASNSLAITNGGSVSNRDGYIGRFPGAVNNNVSVDGAGSTWANSSGLYVGDFGASNSLIITNGGSVSNSHGYIGIGISAVNNNVSVDGAGSTWANSSYLTVGDSGASNSLAITTGGSVSNSYGYIGYNAGAVNNNVSVDGAGSTWANSINLTVGDSGASNSLAITTGGSVSNSYGYIGYNTGADTNNVSVDGAGSTWVNSLNLTVGYSGASNSLAITNGGSVSNTKGIIGYQSGADNNNVSVDGLGSTWSNSSLAIGQAGNSGNLLSISNGGVVNVAGQVLVNTGNTLSIIDGGILTFGSLTSAGNVSLSNSFLAVTSEAPVALRGQTTLDALSQITATGIGAELLLGGTTNNGGSVMASNNGKVTLESGATMYNAITRVTDNGTVTVETGATLSGGFVEAADAGSTIDVQSGAVIENAIVQAFNGGNLNVDGNINAGSVRIFNNGTLTGSGTINADLFNTYGGLIGPGNSPGTMNIIGDYIQDDWSTLMFELAGLTPGSEYDVFNVSGTATLGGELDVQWYDLGDGLFNAGLGDSFDIFTADNFIGEFDLLTLAILGEGLGWQLDYLIDEIGTTDVLRLSVVNAVPVPAAVWLFGSGLIGLAGFARRKKA
ncbi:MAG: VPLPA-CTERM sorting domain-containing protein [Gammaproteobacteria bacterium]|nr:VPLPA-CTERM sorting domain-containing protein [Gammaproteobacteria bacterium]